jgi:hypothetical protein
MDRVCHSGNPIATRLHDAITHFVQQFLFVGGA